LPCAFFVCLVDRFTDRFATCCVARFGTRLACLPVGLACLRTGLTDCLADRLRTTFAGLALPLFTFLGDSSRTPIDSPPAANAPVGTIDKNTPAPSIIEMPNREPIDILFILFIFRCMMCSYLDLFVHFHRRFHRTPTHDSASTHPQRPTTPIFPAMLDP
jgi:hypothetical protein